MSKDLRSMCRTCLSEPNIYHQLFDYVDEDYKIVEMLEAIVPQINITSSSQLSTVMCQICVDKLLAGYKFQQLCIETNNRLHDLLGIVLFETEPTLVKTLDPLNGETNLKIKQEIEEDACFVTEIRSDKLNEELRLDYNNRLPDGINSDTDSSNEKLSVLKKRSAKKISLKIENDEKSHKLKVHKQNADIHNKKSEKNLKTHMLTHTEKEYSFNAVVDCKEILETNRFLDDDNGAKESKNIDFVVTDIGEVEKPNSSNRRNGSFPCEVCGKIFNRLFSLKRHSSVHSLARPYECEICKYRFADAQFLKGHLFKHKNDTGGSFHLDSRPKGFKCPNCPRRFEKQNSLSVHRLSHTRNTSEGNYPCRLCHRNFNTRGSLTEHIVNKHPEVEKLKCDQCGKTFVFHDHLDEHLNRHKGNTLKEHMRTHNGESPYLCPQCGKTFASAGTLGQHMERHTGLKKYRCPECPSRFNCKSDLIKHASTHSNAKNHVCDICGSRYTRSHSLQLHKMRHSGERPFKCGQCNRALTQLRQHMRTHTGEKPHKCKYCERAFAASGDLNKHLRTHVGENTYMCDQCPMAFKYHAELKQHQSQHYKMAQKQSAEAHHNITEQEKHGLQEPQEFNSIHQNNHLL